MSLHARCCTGEHLLTKMGVQQYRLLLILVQQRCWEVRTRCQKKTHTSHRVPEACCTSLSASSGDGACSKVLTIFCTSLASEKWSRREESWSSAGSLRGEWRHGKPHIAVAQDHRSAHSCILCDRICPFFTSTWPTSIVSSLSRSRQKCPSSWNCGIDCLFPCRRS
jgi:hypothetical protein